MIRIADSSFLYALISETDEFHSRALVDIHAPDPVLIPSEALGETLGLLQRRHGFEAARDAKAWFESHPHFRIGFSQRNHYEAGSRTFLAMRGSVDYTDSMVLAWASLARGSVLTYDRAMRRAASRRRS